MKKDKAIQLAKSVGKLRRVVKLPKRKKEKIKSLKTHNRGRVKSAKKDGEYFVIEATRLNHRREKSKVILRNKDEFEVYKDLCTLNKEDLA